MDIEIQDLKNAGLKQEFINQYIKGLKQVFEGKNIQQLKKYLLDSQLTNSQKSLLSEYTKQEYCKQKKVSPQVYEHQIGKVLAIGGAVGGASSIGMGLGLSAVGFTTSGVAKASIAASIQSAIGSVQAGSAFAIAQSIGAKGLFFSPVTALVLTGVGAGVGLSIYFCKKFLAGKQQKVQSEKNQNDKIKQQITPSG